MGDNADSGPAEEVDGEPLFTLPDGNEPVELLTAALILIIATMLCLWYYSVSERRKQEYNEKIAKLKESIKETQAEIEEVSNELDSLRKYKEATICEDILQTTQANLQQLALEFRKAQLGEDYDKYQATRIGQVKIQIDEALQESLNLREKLETLRNSVILPETRCIVEEFGKRNLTPVMVIKCVLEKIQDNKGARQTLSLKSKELKDTIRCIEEQLKDDEETVEEMKKEVERVCNEREYNQILERQKLDNRCSIQKLREYNAQKEASMLDNMDEIKCRDVQIIKINKELDEVIANRTKLVPQLRECLGKREDWAGEMLSRSEDLERFFKSIKTQMETDLNCDLLRQMVGKKLCDFQKFVSQISSKIALDDKLCIQSGSPMGDCTSDVLSTDKFDSASSKNKSWGCC